MPSLKHGRIVMDFRFGHKRSASPDYGAWIGLDRQLSRQPAIQKQWADMGGAWHGYER
jgi:hypothetical protein